MRRLSLLLLISCSACTVPTSVLLEIRGTSGLGLDELRLTVFDELGVAVSGRRLPATGDPHLPDKVALFPRDRAGTLRIIVRALDHGQRVGEGATLAVTRPGAQVTATLTVEPGLLPDGDGDGVPDVIDNCPQQVNPQQDPCLPSPDGGRDLVLADGQAEAAPPDGPPGERSLLDRAPAERVTSSDRAADSAKGDRSPPDQALSVEPGPPSLQLVVPKGGEIWTTGSTQTISWTASGPVSGVSIELWKAGVKDQDIATGQPASGSYTWTVPAKGAANTYRMRIVDPLNTAVEDTSPSFTITPWHYYRAVAVQNTGTQALSNYPVAIALAPAGFDFSKARTDGADVRFATQTGAVSFDLFHWIESWKSTGATVWVLVPQLAAGQTLTVYLVYGNAGATTTSSSTSTFPNRWVSTGAATLTGTQSYDWFELQVGHTLKLTAAQPLIVNARRIAIAGTIDGKGLGYAGGAVGVKGSGPGGGATSGTGGAGGGGHGGGGGAGGYDPADALAAGGVSNGSATTFAIDMGSGGGGGSAAAGGAGGGALTLSARSILLSGTINLGGAAGVSAPRSSGGGAGGGLLVEGVDVSLGAGIVDLSGGVGGSMTAVGNDGGGGGGGGRYKVFHDKSYVAPTAANLKLAGGAGGTGGDTAPGIAGQAGSSNSTTRSFAEPTTVSVATETKL